MLGRLAFSVLSVAIAACTTQPAADTTQLPPSVAERATAAPRVPSPMTTGALPSPPLRKPTRQALADAPPAPAAPPVVEPPKTPPLPDDAEIYEQIIEESRAQYPGPCACPYDTDRAGRRCGGRSAYSRPGGASPYCYPRDVPSELIERRRSMAPAKAAAIGGI